MNIIKYNEFCLLEEKEETSVLIENFFNKISKMKYYSDAINGKRVKALLQDAQDLMDTNVTMLTLSQLKGFAHEVLYKIHSLMSDIVNFQQNLKTAFLEDLISTLNKLKNSIDRYIKKQAKEYHKKVNK